MQKTIFVLAFCLAVGSCKPPENKVVVLTFDDAVKSHITYVAPLLKELGFGATFFVSARWMSDTANFMTWHEIGELHRMGFEIGNHSWSHLDYSIPENIARLEGELGLIDLHLKWQDVPKPISFAYCGNWFSPETANKLHSLGYRFARRGMQPEIPYGEISPGPLYKPSSHHPLLIPSAGDAYPQWDLHHFKKVVNRSTNDEIAVLQFHGVPDRAHEWVTTDPELFKKCMQYLKDEDFQVIAVRDLQPHLPKLPPDDPMMKYTHSSTEDKTDLLPIEIATTRQNPEFWVRNMLVDHQYTLQEAQLVTGFSEDSLEKIKAPAIVSATTNRLKILPYPGGRHPRMGFLDGAFDPMRGTKFSVFLPDDPYQYLVVDLPEAIFSNLGLTFLAHRHFPTIWDYQHTFIDNVDWHINPDGSLENQWTLPNGIAFGATAIAGKSQVDMALWLYNGTDSRLDSLKTQVCVMLKGAPDFNQTTNDNKRFASNTAAVKSHNSDQWILTRWERTFNPWGNPPVPCMHTDPMFEACEPGDTVRLKGKLWFYEGKDIEQFLD